MSGSIGQCSCLDVSSAPPQMLFFTVNGQFRDKHHPSSAGSCLGWFQLPIIQAWLSSESVSEGLQQQQQQEQQLGSPAGGGLSAHGCGLGAVPVSLAGASPPSPAHRGISEDAQQGLGQHGVGVSKPWHRELSVGHRWQ